MDFDNFRPRFLISGSVSGLFPHLPLFFWGGGFRRPTGQRSSSGVEIFRFLGVFLISGSVSLMKTNLNGGAQPRLP